MTTDPSASAERPSPLAPLSITIGEVVVSFEAAHGRDGKSVWRKVGTEHWRYLRPGWTEDQVRQLLGGPVSVRPTKSPTGEAVSVWHYSRGVFGVSSGKGTVTFKDGKVVGFAAPALGYAQWMVNTPTPEA